MLRCPRRIGADVFHRPLAIAGVGGRASVLLSPLSSASSSWDPSEFFEASSWEPLTADSKPEECQYKYLCRVSVTSENTFGPLTI